MCDERKRSANFGPGETTKLVNLVLKHQHILGNKKTDRFHARAKAAAWKKIEIEFNVCGGEIFRGSEVLKQRYENIKKTTKRKNTEEKRPMNVVGNEPEIKLEIIDADETLNDPIECLPPFLQADAICKTEYAMNDEPFMNGINEEEEDHSTRKKHIPLPDTKKMEEPLFLSPIKASAHHKWNQLAEIKIKLVEEQRRFQKEKHDMELRHMAEEHAYKMNIFKAQLEQIKKND